MDIIWRSDFDLCTLFILALFAWIYHNKTRFATFTGKIYTLMLVDLFLATVVEYIEIYVSHINPIATPAVKCILLCLYEVLICLLAFMFSIYVFLTSRKGIYSKQRWVWYIGYAPAGATLLMICTTQLTHLVFYFENGQFHTGPMYFGVYIIIALYLFFALIMTIVSRKTILLRNRLSFYMFLFCTACGMIYQAVTVGGLVGNFCCALGMVLIYVFQESNYDALDATTNLYNKPALLIHMNELINIGQPFRVVALTPDGFMETVHNKGSFYAESLIASIGERIKMLYGTTGAYYIGSGMFVVITFDEWKEDIRKKINESLERPYIIGTERFEFTTSGVYLQYPDDFETGDMAMSLVVQGMDIASKSEANTLVTIDNFTSIRDNVIMRMKKEQAELEREKHEAELAKETAETSDRAKTTFLAHMSHEIRTPLTTIMGMTEILLRDELNSDVRDDIIKINTSSKSLLQIINDILDFSKIEAGRMEIVNEPFEVIPTIESAVNVLNVRCDSKPISIVTEIDESLPSVLVGDETRIRQILFNLLSNAAKYTEQGTITFSVKWNPDTSLVEVSVRDTGRGIREADMARLFDSFSRFDAHANKAIEGTGLGLAITERMIGLMGGELHVESEYGKGSCFSFSLRHEVSDATPISEVDINGHKRYHGSELRYFIAPEARILIVDDNLFNRKIAEELIRPHMIQIEQAESGQECLKMVSASKYDLIFLDHMMPEMDGFETLKKLQELPDFDMDVTPVIAFTANAVSGMKEMFSAAGFSDFLTKPIEIESLEHMLADYLPEAKLKQLSREEFEDIIHNSRGQSATYDMASVRIDGIDVEEGLSHSGGDADRYFKLADVILDDADNSRNRLTRDFEDRNVEDYTICVHAMKSNLASIGAQEASGLARELEQASREGDWQFVIDRHGSFISVHKEICDALSKAKADYDAYVAQQSGTAVMPDLSGLMPDRDDCLNCIRLLMDECEYDSAISLVGLFTAVCGEGIQKDELEGIKSKLEQFDYDGVTAMLEELI